MLPAPEITLNTPLGIISFTSFASSSIERGVEELLFNTVQHPDASTGASFHAAIRNGKFHGTICPTTPIGSLNTRESVFESRKFEVSSSVRIAEAKYLKWSAANGMSTFNVSRRGLPLSRLSIYARSSLFASITSAIFKRISALFILSRFFHESKAAHAAFTASSTSSFVASATLAIFSLVAGE